MDLLTLPKWKLPLVRGTGISMVFQEPINSLNPAFRVFDQLAEAVRIRKMRESGQAPGLVPGSEGFDYSKREGPKPADALTRPLLPSRPEARKGFSRVLHRVDFPEDALNYLRLVPLNTTETTRGLHPHRLSPPHGHRHRNS